MSKKVSVNGTEAAVFVLFVIPLMLALAFFGGGAVIYGAWNYGVAAVADVPRVSYWPACFISLGLGVVRNLLHGNSK